METAIIVLITLFIMMFIVNLINGNMIGRRDGVRGTSNCMIFLQPFLSVPLFFRVAKHIIFGVSYRRVRLYCI